MNNDKLRFLREQYPVGTRIRLNELRDPYTKMAPGTTGTLMMIDDIGTFHVKWDNGRTLGLVYGEDSFSVLPQTHEMKLWMPLTADLYQEDEWGDLYDENEVLDGYSLAQYEGEIQDALENYVDSEETERGLMHWYHEHDGVSQKVQSVFFQVELRDGRLWGVADCTLCGDLAPEELNQLKDYIAGQASDGWGEGFEQHEIHLEDGDLYVHLWNSDHWNILTEDECFSPKFAPGLPAHCYSVLNTTGELIILKRGESGYYRCEASTNDKDENIDLADEYNEHLNVTPAQRQAMEIGSMFGWDVPGADPANYEIGQITYDEQDEDGPVLSM